MLCAALLQEEKAATQYFQPMPFYYVEISKLLFHDAVEAFGDSYMEEWSNRHMSVDMRVLTLSCMRTYLPSCCPIFR